MLNDVLTHPQLLTCCKWVCRWSRDLTEHLFKLTYSGSGSDQSHSKEAYLIDQHNWRRPYIVGHEVSGLSLDRYV